MQSKFIAVRTGRPAEIPSYLYDHTEILADIHLEWDRRGFVLRASAPDRVHYLAQYQADRLSSGLHGAVVYDTAVEAYESLAA